VRSMEIFDGHRALFRPLAAPAIALGNFDGVHVGHQRLIERAVARAAEVDGDAVVYTFDPHPARVLAPKYAPPLITSRERKLELFAELGISVCVLEPFTPELAAMSPQTFLQQIVVDTLQARHVVVGYDFTFGKKRAGTTATLTEFGAAHGFETEIIEPVTVEGIIASSTKVREMVLEGNMEGAALLLGRPFDVDGQVVRGDGRGRTIGFPTANVDMSTELVPATGVYAVRLLLLDDAAGTAIPGVANLGTKPTFKDDDAVALEVHLFDFDEDIYGRPVRVSMIERLRGEKRFSGVEELVAQIRADADDAREVLGAPTSS
jgi:riboflavin kinase/FMN adenylyltransferase